jgi:RNase H-fold protein (predicted Holliday junction resolvase)
VYKGSLLKDSRLRNNRSNFIQVIPTANKYVVLTNLKDIDEAPSVSSALINNDITAGHFTNTNQKTMKGLNSSGVRRQRVIVIGDSHVRNCAAELQLNLGDGYEVSGFTKPGAGIEEIVNSVREDIQTMSNKDVVVVWGGANDIEKNNSKVALNHLNKFVEEKKEVNLVIMTAPLRHDLMPSSCVNTKVIKFHRQMEKRMKTYHNVKLFDTNLDRSYFKRHGQHLNLQSKELITAKLSIVIKELLIHKQLTPIPMPWKEMTHSTDLNHNNMDKLLENTDDSMRQQKNEVKSVKPKVCRSKKLKGTTKIIKPPKTPKTTGSLKEHKFFMDLTNRDMQSKNITDNKGKEYIKIYHQNIRGLEIKSSELIAHLHPDYPHVLCITEHHFKHFQIKHIFMEKYKLGSFHCKINIREV